MRVGEKDVSEQTEIVKRYADLFSVEQLEALREAEDAASGDERELLYRLRKTCEGGLISAALVEREDELENRMLAERITFRDEEMPLRNAQAQLAVLTAYGDREELGEIQAAASAAFNDDRLGLIAAAEQLAAELSGVPDPIERNEEEKAISLRELSGVLKAASDTATDSFAVQRDAVVREAPRPGPRGGAVELPHRLHAPALAARVDLHEGARDRDLPGDADRARLRPRRGDQHQARPRRPAAEGAARLRDRERSAERRAPDHARPGRAARLPGVPARGRPRAPLRRRRPGAPLHLPAHLARPRADRDLLVHRRSDHPRAGLAQSTFRPFRRHRRAENADATIFLEALLFRRYEAKLRYELGFWTRFPEDGGTPEGYEEFLTAATGIRYRADHYLSDMDAGFYSADYLRAWIRSAQLRRHLIQTVGEDWWRNPATGELLRRAVRRGHEAVERGDREAHRLRPARHGAAAARDRRVARLHCRGHDGAHSSSGLGHRPLTAAARVRIPYGP